MTLENTDISVLAETAIVAARLAGQRAMEQIKYLKVTEKAPNELVTDADVMCQKLIISRVKETYPDHGFIAEEGTEGKIFKQPPRDEDKIWWVIDPIDGTTNYAHKIPNFAVSIAVLHENRPIVGVVFQPATEDMFTAVKDGEAQLNNSAITVSEEKFARTACLGISSHWNEINQKWPAELLDQVKIRDLGTTAMHLAYVASGGLIAAVTCGVKLWDYAAGAFIAERAGAQVTDFKGDKIWPADADNYEGQSNDLICANPNAHSKLIENIQR